MLKRIKRRVVWWGGGEEEVAWRLTSFQWLLPQLMEVWRKQSTQHLSILAAMRLDE